LSAARFLDGSDEPLGLVAIGALAVLTLRDWRLLRGPPRPGWLVAGAALACAAVVTAGYLPALLRGVLASLAVTAMLAALRRETRGCLPLLVLALLSLPILSSLQFYLGYPLRVITAGASAALLSTAGLAVQRFGSALSVNGALVIVDAPCAGIHMAWTAWFTAAVIGAWRRLAARTFALQSSCIGFVVIVANVLRNSVLVALEARPAGLSATWHEAIGIAAFGLVCLVTTWQLGRARTGCDTYEMPPLRFGSTAGATQ
jgi:exosortase/archaeosortase family protein